MHNIADALSRSPIIPGSKDMDIQVDTALAHLATTKDQALNVIYESIDSDYLQFIKDISNDTNISQLSKQLKNIKGDISTRDKLILLDAKWIVLPKPAIKPIMSHLHIGLARQENTFVMAKQLYFWHRMANNIKNISDNCDECQTCRPS